MGESLCGPDRCATSGLLVIKRMLFCFIRRPDLTTNTEQPPIQTKNAHSDSKLHNLPCPLVTSRGGPATEHRRAAAVDGEEYGDDETSHNSINQSLVWHNFNGCDPVALGISRRSSWNVDCGPTFTIN